jgi:hypothetical protein
MSRQIPSKRGPGAAELNERLALPVAKSGIGMDEVSLIPTCLNIKAPSSSLIQKKVNKMCDKAEEAGEAQLLKNQDYLGRVLTMSGKKGDDVQTDRAYACRPQAGGEIAKQSFSAVIEHNTSRGLVLSQATANKFCKKRG